ncbi:MAG: anion permease [Balneola sp.]|nr:anion permease [Balneola sp.]MBO6649896.1 anion permease [Balneola sp.]MBO6711757.1 anion permease [Balneola sp.]MBO6799951.1 anion permease [Balneola sp.]MBO6871196.1 anion permease [Balneola sp.]
MTFEAWAVVAVLVICLVLLISTKISADLILIGGLALLVISGIVPTSIALDGFSNEGMLTVAALYIVAAGLKETGAIQYVVQKVMGNASTVRESQFRIMSPVMIMSAFFNNTPIVASFIPALEKWSRRTGIPVSKVLIPLSYAAILGGTCTLIGTSTNLILNGLLIEEASTRSLGLFEPALVGVPCAIAGFIYLLICGDKLLPNRSSSIESFRDTREYAIEMIVEEKSSLVSKSIEDVGLRNLTGLFLAEIIRDGRSIPAVGPHEKLKGNDRLVFIGMVESIIDIQQIQGLKLATDQIFKLDSPRRERVLVESVVSASNPILGRTIRESGFRNRYNAVVLAVSRSGERLSQKIGDIKLRSGDTLLLEAHPEFLSQYRNSNDFYLMSSIEDSAPTTYDGAFFSVSVLFGMVILAGTGLLSMLQASFLAAVFMIVLKCTRYSQALENIDWRVLIAIGSSLGLGSALETTGAAVVFAEGLLGFAQSDPMMALILTYLCTWVLTEMITNNAAAVLVFPIALAVALEMGVSFMPFAMIIIMGASASFSTPIGYQTNLMIYGPGGYRYTDYIKIGLPLNLIVGFIAVTLIPLIWKF